MSAFTWVKLDHAFVRDPKFHAVAAAAGASVALAREVFTEALVCASEAADRGSLEKFDLRVVAASLREPVELVAGVFAALEEFALVAGGRIAGWAKRQGGSAARSAAARRTAAWRARRAHPASQASQASQRASHPPSHVTSHLFESTACASHRLSERERDSSSDDRSSSVCVSGARAHEDCEIEAGREADPADIGATAAPAGPPRPPDPVTLDREFDRLWQVWPRRECEAEARAEYRKKRRCVEAAAILEGVRRAAQRYRTVEARYVPRLAKWLAGERWRDADQAELLLPLSPQSAPPGGAYADARYRDPQPRRKSAGAAFTDAWLMVRAAGARADALAGRGRFAAGGAGDGSAMAAAGGLG